MTQQSPLSNPISLRLPSDVLAAVESIASASERPRSWIIVRALRRYIATEGVEVLEVAAGREQIASGKAHDLDKALGELEHELRTGSGKAA